MHDSLRSHHLPECFDHTIEQEGLTWLKISDGAIALSAAGREFALAEGSAALRRRAERYRQVVLGNGAVTHEGVRTYINKGKEGSVYTLGSLAKVAVKEITSPHNDSPLIEQLTHMEALREQVDAAGLAWIGVPKHYAMFFPDDSSAPHLAMEKIEGVRLWNMVRPNEIPSDSEFFHPIPEEYAADMPEAIATFPLIEPMLRRRMGADGFDTMMNDWGSHNIIVEKTPSASRPHKYWIIDQASTPFA